MMVITNKAIGKAHGKIILIGEHAVVYNEPAIAIPFTSASVEVSIEQTDKTTTINSVYYIGDLEDAPKSLDNLVATLDAVCNYLKVSSDNMNIHIQSNIPPERGMGSSAAVATAVVRALFNYFETELSNDLLYHFVSISEKIAHGNPSGLDATVVSSKEAVYYTKGEKPTFFNYSLPAYLVVADTGKKGETLQAVSDVGDLVRNKNSNGQQLVHDLGKLTKQTKNLIENQNVIELGAVLNRAQHKLNKLTVSDERLDILIETALKNDALGAKLTGGGRGGCMISLTDNYDKALLISNKLEEAGAVKTWIHPLGENK